MTNPPNRDSSLLVVGGQVALGLLQFLCVPLRLSQLLFRLGLSRLSLPIVLGVQLYDLPLLLVVVWRFAVRQT